MSTADGRDTAVNPVLCYIDGCWAYFTTQPLDKQWGDDWNDAPYEHNAGSPYTYASYNQERGDLAWEITTIAFDRSYLSTPAELAHSGNSRYSVEMINAKLTPWLRTDEWYSKEPVAIYAGTPLGEFIKTVQGMGGRVYIDPTDRAALAQAGVRNG